MFAVPALLALHMSAVAISEVPCDCAADGTRAMQAPAGSSIDGTIRDSAGGVVPGAAVVIRAGDRERRVITGPDGRFTGPAEASGDVTIVVRAPGFAELRHTVAENAPRTDLDLVVIPASVTEAVTVTATRGERRRA